MDFSCDPARLVLRGSSKRPYPAGFNRNSRRPFNLPRDVADHVRLRFRHGRNYNVLQKLSYGFVLFVLLPLMVLTGLTMSPGVDAAVPWLTEIFGGRQTARTVHFLGMLLLVSFFVVHIFMVFAAGPINELRSIITGLVSN